MAGVTFMGAPRVELGCRTVRALGASCDRLCPGVLLRAVWARSGPAGAPWEPAALGFRGNNRAGPGNSSSGRKAAAPGAALAEQAPDALSVQPSVRRSRAGSAPALPVCARDSCWPGCLLGSQCPEPGSAGVWSYSNCTLVPLGGSWWHGGPCGDSQGILGPQECSACSDHPALGWPVPSLPRQVLVTVPSCPESWKAGIVSQVATAQLAQAGTAAALALVTSGFDGPTG